MHWGDVENKIKALVKEVKDDADLSASREKSLVLTKLDEARMWAIEAIDQKQFANIPNLQGGGRHG